MRGGRYEWVAVVPVLLLAYGLAVPHFLDDAVWFDEAYTHLRSGTGLVPPISLWESLALTARLQSWPPAYFVLNWFWGRLVGVSPIVDYTLPALVGVVALAVTYRMVRALYGGRSGGVATLLVGTSALYIHYMHEARPYTLYVLAVALCVWFYWMLVNRLRYRVRWLTWGFAGAVGLALYTHYVAVAFLAGLFSYHLLCERPGVSANPEMNRSRWRLVIRLWVNGGLAFAPWVAVMVVSLAAEGGDDRALAPLAMLGHTVYSLSNGLWGLLLAALAWSVVSWRRRPVVFTWVWLAGSALVILIVNVFLSFLFHPRHILPLLLLVVLFVVPALAQVAARSRWVAGLLVGVWVVAGVGASRTPTFMVRIPTHIQPLPLPVVTEMRAVVDACVVPEGAAVFALVPVADEPWQDVVLQYYLIGADMTWQQVGGLLSPDDGTTGVRAWAAGKDVIWAVAWPERGDAEALASLGAALRAAGIVACPSLGWPQHVTVTPFVRGGQCETVMSACRQTDANP